MTCPLQNLFDAARRLDDEELVRAISDILDNRDLALTCPIAGRAGEEGSSLPSSPVVGV